MKRVAMRRSYLVAGYPLSIPAAAMSWALDEANDVRQRNPHLSFDELAAVLVLRGVTVGQLHLPRAKLGGTL